VSKREIDRLPGFIVFGLVKNIFLHATGNKRIIQGSLVDVAFEDIGFITLFFEKFVQ
jgi:hypothetical protein